MRVAELCAGYGGLFMSLQLAGWPVELAWYAETDPDAAAVMAAHHPGAANVGDVTRVDWASCEPVDVITAGYPCQPFSVAGRKRGIDDERWIWPDIANAVRDLRPRLVLLENVPGHLARGAAEVVADLAASGYVGSWCCVRAADVGAPHLRERLFVLAADADRHPVWEQPVAVAGGGGAAVAGVAGTGPVELLPTPTARDHKGRNQRGDATCLPGALLPTPNAALGRGTGSPSPETARNRFDHGKRFLDDAVALLPTPTATDGEGGPRAVPERRTHDGPDHGPRLRDVAPLLPTPRASDGEKGGPNQRDSHGNPMLSAAVQPGRWGRYDAAIARWERVTGRPAPEPTEPGNRGQPRLSPLFVEWLMGLPAGWVTDHVGRAAALRILGNGVVPQQGALGVQQLAAHLQRMRGQQGVAA